MGYNNIGANNARPSQDMTDESWQMFFDYIKDKVKPTSNKRMYSRSLPVVVYGLPSQCTYTYHGDTQWEIYCKYINDVLSSIRRGENDYCFYPYQITELLRFEHDKLRTKWLPHSRCFQVWLEQV